MVPDQPTLRDDHLCPNCQATLNGPYCSSCGQRQIDLDQPFRELADEAMESFLSFHLHSFAFLALLIGLLIDLAMRVGEGEGLGNGFSVLVIAVYSFLALRRVYGHGRFLTVVKMAALLIGYLVALIATTILTLALTAVTVYACYGVGGRMWMLGARCQMLDAAVGRRADLVSGIWYPVSGGGR